MRIFRTALLAAVFATPLAAGEHSETITLGDLTLSGFTSFATPPSAKTAAGYLTIQNNGSEADRLISADVTFARSEIHDVETDSAGVTRMVHQHDGIEIAAGETVILKQGGYHVMFMGLDAPFVEGEARAATLVFEKAGEVDVTFDVIAR